MGRLIVVKATWDPEAGVWVAESGDVPGLVTEAETLDVLTDKLPGLIQDLLDEEGGQDVEIPVEIVAHTSSRARIRARAA
jgi:predicted RNase H-like HicB family nuclease